MEFEVGLDRAPPNLDVRDDVIVVEHDADEGILDRFQEIVHVQRVLVAQVQDPQRDGFERQVSLRPDCHPSVHSHQLLPFAQPCATTHLLRDRAIRDDELERDHGRAVLLGAFAEGFQS
jgi:hypothetical protein